MNSANMDRYWRISKPYITFYLARWVDLCVYRHSIVAIFRGVALLTVPSVSTFFSICDHSVLTCRFHRAGCRSQTSVGTVAVTVSDGPAVESLFLGI
jgi:hypothetical protein